MMPRRYLITGCSGFWGSHLAPILAKEGHQVFGTCRSHSLSFEGVTSLPCDLANREAVREAVRVSRPDVIFHLAAQAYIPAAWKDFEGTFQTNVFGTYYLLDAVRGENLKSRIIIAGSSTVYGTLGKDETSLSEEHPFKPADPYGLSKVTQDLLGRMYHDLFELVVIRFIPFYVIGPKKEPDAPSDFAKAIVRHRQGQTESLKVGNLNVIRDVVDIRDAIRALRLIEEKAPVGSVYNICSGMGISLKEILEKMISLSHSKLKVVVDSNKFRVGDRLRIVGNPDHLKALGWEPTVSLEETLQGILDYWEKS